MSDIKLKARDIKSSNVPVVGQVLSYVDEETLQYVDNGGTPEQFQDNVGGMFTGNVQSNITSTYNDTTGKIDLVVNAAALGGNIVAGTSFSAGSGSGTSFWAGFQPVFNKTCQRAGTYTISVGSGPFLLSQIKKNGSVVAGPAINTVSLNIACIVGDLITLETQQDGFSGFSYNIQFSYDYSALFT